ncbi:unnamed protein product [Cuscuta epithymum]|uniref:Uncharacterized protein n=1 Tax=Cuscuta epithymum TaxID=186058 RepID=A0AAV0CYG2_9ASTE|nr:unnamed protein product [Cuscuta epithymum]
MALSAPPAPPNVSSAAAADASPITTTTTTTRPLYTNSRPPLTLQSHPLPPQSQRFASNPNPIFSQLAPPPNQSTLYPIAPSGRGVIPRPPIPYPPPNQSNYLTRGPPVGYAPGSILPPFLVSAHTDPGLRPGLGFPEPTNLTHAHVSPVTLPNSTANGTPLIPVVVNGVPVTSAHPKPLPSFADFSGSKDGRDRSKSDSFSVVRERKVKVSDTASLYTLCRSWLRNGFLEDTQLQYRDVVKSLPKPLPVAPQDAESPENKEVDKGPDEEDDVSVEHLTKEKLLLMHVTRAKKIRSKLRDERLRRIARYKTRLALLLPPMVDQTHHSGG